MSDVDVDLVTERELADKWRHQRGNGFLIVGGTMIGFSLYELVYADFSRYGDTTQFTQTTTLVSLTVGIVVILYLLESLPLRFMREWMTLWSRLWPIGLCILGTAYVGGGALYLAGWRSAVTLMIGLGLFSAHATWQIFALDELRRLNRWLEKERNTPWDER